MPRIFYGWILVVILLLLVSIGMGTTMYMYSVVAGAVGQEYGTSRLVLMAGSTGMLLVMALCSPAVGRMLDHVSSRGVLTVGSITMGFGFLCVALSTHIWMVVASYVLFISVGAATLSLLTTAILLTRWFVRYRGLAIGIAALGTQFGGFIYPPLFATAMTAYDWRIAAAGTGILIMILGPLVTWLFVVDRPEQRNLRPLGWDQSGRPSATSVAADEAPEAVTLSFARLLGQRSFWLIVAISGVSMATNTTLLANLSLFAVDLGEPIVRGAFLVSLVALIGIGASPLLGWLCDVINIKLVAAIMTLSLAAACLLFGAAESYSALLVAALFMGVGGGGVFPIYASLVGQLFDTRIYGQVLGTTTMLQTIIAAVAPLFAGRIFDATGSYRPLFAALLVMLLAATAAITLIRVPR